MIRYLVSIVALNFFISTTLFAQQSVVYTNFEDVNMSLSTFLCTMDIVENPSKSGINTSERVGHVVSTADTWEGMVNSVPLSFIDFTDKQIFKLKVFSPRLAKILIKLEYSVNKETVFTTVYKNTSKVGEWEELSFDFTDAASGVYDNIVLFFDIDATNAGDNWYFDDLQLVSSNPPANQVSLPNIFQNNMVLQQNMDIPVWGFAPAGEKLVITGSWGKTAEATADQQGKWSAKITTPAAVPGEAPRYTLTIAGNSNTVEFSNVLVGEVWVCSGQSNMDFPLSPIPQWTLGVDNYASEIANANYPEIRFFNVAKRPSSLESTNCEGAWVECNPTNVANLSAVAYYFGRELFNDANINIPIGLIQSAFGGSACQAWTSLEVLGSNPELNTKYLVPFQQNPASFSTEYKPAYLYNGMIAPIIPFAIRGFIWYQGESNNSDGDMYRKLCAEMLKGWRKDWGQGDLPFFFVQVAPYNMTLPEPVYATLREAQLNMLTESNTGMAVTTDIGNATNIHPTNKYDVGKRLALWAKAKTYQEDVVFSGPLYESYSIEGNKIRISFKAESVGTGLTTNNGLPPDNFTIAGADQVFHNAATEIEGNDILVSSPNVTNPIAARYAFSNAPSPNLINKEFLPASPFRTDGPLALKLEKAMRENTIEAFPNPFDSQISFRNNTEIKNLELISVSGKSVQKYTLSENEGNAIDTGNIQAGLYFLRIQEKQGETKTVKMVKY